MIGTQIGPYVLLRQLGAGGMGQVYLAEHAIMKDLHAIKILDPQLTQKPQLVTRFVNEARAAAKLRHRNLIRVHHIDRMPNDGPWYMVLDYLDGSTLARFIAAQGGPMAPHTIVHVMAQVCNCIQHVHDHKVVHRDLKPDNIFLIQRDGDPHFPVVLDLGVAQLGEDLATGPGTKTGTVIGTPIYMAPEQLRGERVSPAADIFALGVIAYEMVTGGWYPYQQEPREQFFQLPPTEIYYRQRSAPPTDPRARFAGVSEQWAEAIMAALDPDPLKRPQNARAFALALAQATPTDGISPDGLAIVQEVARELLQQTSVDKTVRMKSTSGSMPPPSTGLGTKDARYQIVEKLGAGGMAEVFLATQVGAEGFERRVAIKRVLTGLSEVPEFANMFVTEARLVSKLSHPNIVTVLDFSRDPEGRLFLVMEFVHGRDLATLLEAGALAPSMIIYIVTEMLRGLGYAHDITDPATNGRGMVHRDVSPQNLLLSYEGAVKVSDFGLAKARSASGNAHSESIRGKPGYMSPEQCNGESLDARSDLFAVGVMLWEMLANQPLFNGTPREIIAQIMFKQIPAPSSLRSRIPADLEAVTMRLLERERDARYPNAEAVIADLLRCDDAPRDGRGDLARVLSERFPDAKVRSRASGVGSGAASATAGRALVAQQIAAAAPLSTLGGAASQSLDGIGGRRRSARGVVVAVGGVVVVAVGAVIGMAVMKGGAGKQSASTSVASSPSPTPTPTANPTPSPTPSPSPTPTPTPSPSPSPSPTPTANPNPNPTPSPNPPPTPTSVPADAAVVPPHTPAPTPTATPHVEHHVGNGELAIVVAPWATVTIDGRGAGQTPYRGTLAAGKHRIRLQNDEAGKDETVTITITAGQMTNLQRSW